MTCSFLQDMPSMRGRRSRRSTRIGPTSRRTFTESSSVALLQPARCTDANRFANTDFFAAERAPLGAWRAAGHGRPSARPIHRSTAGYQPAGARATSPRRQVVGAPAARLAAVLRSLQRLFRRRADIVQQALATQMVRPCAISRCENTVHSFCGTSFMRSCSIFTGSKCEVRPRRPETRAT